MNLDEPAAERWQHIVQPHQEQVCTKTQSNILTQVSVIIHTKALVLALSAESNDIRRSIVQELWKSALGEIVGENSEQQLLT